MGALADDPRWTEAFPRLVRTGQDRKLRRLLEEAETIHRNAAARLRALGWDDQARRAEQFAAWIRLDLDEPRAARRLYSVTRDLRRVVGVVSTHYPRPFSPSGRDLEIMKRYGELVGQAVADHVGTPSGSSPLPGVADCRPLPPDRPT